ILSGVELTLRIIALGSYNLKYGVHRCTFFEELQYERLTCTGQLWSRHDSFPRKSRWTRALSSAQLIKTFFALQSAPSLSTYNAMASVHQKVATGQRDVRLRSLDGCQTCRRRRVKCDESKPRCNGCIRLNHSCSWTRTWKFKDHTSLVAGGYRVSAGPQNCDQYRPTSTGIMASLQWLPVWNACPADADMDHDLEVPLHRIQRPQKLRSRECRMPLQLDNALTERSQLLNSALFHYLPSDEYNLGKKGLDASASINILTLHNRPISNPQSSALKAAIDTFSLAQAALVLGDARFAAASVRRYVVGVAALRSALSRPQDSSRDELILAMLIFQLVEIMKPTSQKGVWAVHNAGAQRFVESLGPWQLQDRYEGALFDSVRQNAILWGIVHKKEIPFDQRIWRAMSEAAISVTSERRLIDIGTMIPGLLVVTQDLLQGSVKDGDYIPIWQNLTCVQENLLTWIHHYHTESSFAVKACNAKTSPAYFDQIGTTSDLLGHGFVFPKFHDAWFMSTAWIYLYAIQNALLRVAQITSGIATKEYLDELQKSVHIAVWNMCQTIPKLLEHSFGFVGRICIFLTSSLRRMYFEAIGDLNMVEWCQRIDAILHWRGGVAPLWMSKWDDAVRPCLNETNRRAEEFNGMRLRL
ncbi:hypothetical protein D6D15_08531, partial [Aureobasidium pullulans]